MNIVNELRKHGKITGCGLTLSAADEIERLREALLRISLNTYGDLPAQVIAGEALKEYSEFNLE